MLYGVCLDICVRAQYLIISYYVKLQNRPFHSWTGVRVATCSCHAHMIGIAMCGRDASQVVRVVVAAGIIIALEAIVTMYGYLHLSCCD